MMNNKRMNANYYILIYSVGHSLEYLHDLCPLICMGFEIV